MIIESDHAHRQVVLDTETTGLELAQGHRIIEIGCVELIRRRPTNTHFHRYINPGREVDPGAFEVHGISDEFLSDKPPFEDIARHFLDFVAGAELIIHNASFDVGFIDHELARLGSGWGRLEDHCRVTDSLILARQLHPGQRNSLDALCKRYHIDNSGRELHGALLDARILADVYLAMTGGQKSFSLEAERQSAGTEIDRSIRRLSADRPPLKVWRANEEELRAHAEVLRKLRTSGSW